MPKRRRYQGRDRRSRKPSWTFIGATAVVLGGIAFATLCPIGMRPHLASPDVERMCAFALLGFVTVMAGRRRPILMTCLTLACAMALEGAQALAWGRHARIDDALVKMIGVLVGSFAAYGYFPMRRALRRLRDGETSDDLSTQFLASGEPRPFAAAPADYEAYRVLEPRLLEAPAEAR